MTQNQLGNARNRAIDRIVGMLESSDFDPSNDKNQRHLFDALCKAHAAMVAHWQQIDDANPHEKVKFQLLALLDEIQLTLGSPRFSLEKLSECAKKMRNLLFYAHLA